MKEDYCTHSGDGARILGNFGEGLRGQREAETARNGVATAGGRLQAPIGPSGVDDHGGRGDVRNEKAESGSLESTRGGRSQHRCRRPRKAAQGEGAACGGTGSSLAPAAIGPACGRRQAEEHHSAVSAGPSAHRATPSEPGSSSQPQPQLRRRHGSTLGRGPSDQGIVGRLRDVDFRCEIGESSVDSRCSRSTVTREPVTHFSCAAQRDAPRHGRQTERAAAISDDVIMETPRGAARPLAAATSGSGSPGSCGQQNGRRPAPANLAGQRRHKKTMGCAHGGVLEGEGSAPTAEAGVAKRRRIRGKQTPPPAAAAAGAAAFAANSLHAACSVGPLRSTSAYLESDRDLRAACGDRHGQALVPESAAPAGASGCGGVGSGNGLRDWSARRGRPPEV